MEDLGYYNGVVDRIENIMIPMNDRVHFFGDGVYEVTYARNKRIFALDEHLDRLFNSARMLDINIPLGRDELAHLLQDCVNKVDAVDQHLYWQVTRGTAPRLHSYPEDMQGNLWIAVEEGAIDDMERDHSIITREDTRFLHCNIKTLNLLPAVMYAQEAKRAGCDEAFLVRDGFVTECAHSNAHIIRDGVLITHPADNLILPGIARAHLIATARELGLDVQERPFTPAELMEADEVLFSSSGSFCMRVTEIDGRPAGGRDHDTVRRLQKALLDEFTEATAPVA